MLALIIAPFVIALLIFIFVRTIKHFRNYYLKSLKVVNTIFGVFLFGGLVCIGLGFLISNYTYKRIFFRIGYYYVAFLLFMVIGLGIALLLRQIVWLIIHKKKNYDTKLARNITAIFVLSFMVLMNVYGMIHAHDLQITNYEVSTTKKSQFDELNIVLISDLHLGYNDGIKEMKDMVEKINSQNPDVVVLAGDIFDNEYEAIESPVELAKILSGIKSKYGKFATYGNHDIQEKILLGFTFGKNKKAPSADERMVKFVKDSGFVELYDSYELIDDVYLYGRPDSYKINFGNDSRLSPEQITKDLDKNKYIICVDHEPSELEELDKAGIDLDLSGHTHKGQIWPGTLSIYLFWDNAYGLKQIGNKMISIVTSGVGLFGPNIRVGSDAEIVNIKINFNK